MIDPHRTYRDQCTMVNRNSNKEEEDDDRNHDRDVSDYGGSKARKNSSRNSNRFKNTRMHC